MQSGSGKANFVSDWSIVYIKHRRRTFLALPCHPRASPCAAPKPIPGARAAKQADTAEQGRGLTSPTRRVPAGCKGEPKHTDAQRSLQHMPAWSAPIPAVEEPPSRERWRGIESVLPGEHAGEADGTLDGKRRPASTSYCINKRINSYRGVDVAFSVHELLQFDRGEDSRIL